MKLSSIETYLTHLTRQSLFHHEPWKRYRFKRMQHLLDLLKNPERKIPHYIHITGTSGKGSVAIMLATILKTSGYKTGLLISPHPTHITERWQINNRPMSIGIFEKLFTKIYKQIQVYERSKAYQEFGMISYGELMTIIGLYYFAQEKVEWSVIEVSVGGRNDSTNIIPYKDVAVITTIGIDHTKHLGSTKASILKEKLGILQRGIPLFTAEKDKKILDLMQQECKKQKSILYKINNQYQILPTHNSSNHFIYQKTSYTLPVLGLHQIRNALLSITIAKYLKLPEQKIQKALQTIILPIRLEVISKNPTIILDAAHNRDKMKSTALSIKDLIKSSPGKVYILLASSHRRDILMRFKPLTTLHPPTIICTQGPSTLSPDLFFDIIKKLFPDSLVLADQNYHHAFSTLKKQLQPHDVLLVTGSVYLSGALRNKKPTTLP